MKKLLLSLCLVLLINATAFAHISGSRDTTGVQKYALFGFVVGQACDEFEMDWLQKLQVTIALAAAWQVLDPDLHTLKPSYIGYSISGCVVSFNF